MSWRMRGRHPDLLVTAIAIFFLAIDGILLAWVGIWSERSALLFWGGVFLAGAAVVIIFYRRHRRKMDELRLAKQSMLREIEAMRKVARQASEAEGTLLDTESGSGP